jgi:hypothetical protein
MSIYVRLVGSGDRGLRTMRRGRRLKGRVMVR